MTPFKSFPDSGNKTGSDTSLVTLDVKEDIHLPVVADSICPDRFLDPACGSIGDLPLMVGRRRYCIKDLFDIQGEKSDRIILNGDLSRFKFIGRSMSRGKIMINGPVGMHLGAYMQGGTIQVNGNAGDWTGVQMKGGLIHLKGNAGHYAAAAYVGEKKGVNRGTLVVEGNTGIQTGARMRRGLIVVTGNTGDFPGANMIAGTLIVLGRLGDMPGPGNKRGSIVALGSAGPVLPTYGYQCRYQPGFLCLFKSVFRKFNLDPSRLDGWFQRFAGDINTVGKGEVLVYDGNQ